MWPAASLHGAGICESALFLLWVNRAGSGRTDLRSAGRWEGRQVGAHLHQWHVVQSVQRMVYPSRSRLRWMFLQ